MSNDVGRMESEPLFSPLDRAMGRLFDLLFVRHRVLSLAVSIVAYTAALSALGPLIGVSTNFFVLLPIIAASAGFGLKAGLPAGAMGLPLNLLIFELYGHPEYSPESKIVAEASGVLLGATLGYLSDYHRKLELERRAREASENDLRKALRDRETLFREVHHRVKNNLNMVKSLISLQMKRSSDPAFVEACKALIGRVMTMSFVHERLYRTSELSAIAVGDYLRDLAVAVATVSGKGRPEPDIEFLMEPGAVSIDVAVPLGLVVNELMTNVLRHAGRVEKRTRVRMALERDGDRLTLTAKDDGSGFADIRDGETVGIQAAAERHGDRLGFFLLDLMTVQLGGDASFSRMGGWTEFRLSFPMPRV